MSRVPTFRQLELVRLVYNYTKRNGYPPSRREMTKFMGLSSPNAITQMLASIAEKGLLKVLPNIARGVQVTEEGQRAIGAIA